MDTAKSSAWIQGNQRSSMRYSIQVAHERLKRSQDALAALTNVAHQAPRATEDAAFNLRPPPLSNVRFFVKFDDQRERRGITHAMLCLIEEIGLEELQRAGVVSYFDGTEGQRTYVRDVAGVARTYGVKSHVLVPPNASPNAIQELQSEGNIVTVITDQRKSNSDPTAKALAETGAYRFPLHNESNAINGQGTIALELEDEVAQLLAVNPLPVPQAQPRLHAILSVMGNASALCGVCMACEGTGTRVFGAETVPDPVHAANGPNFPTVVRGEEQYDFDVPMGDVPFSTFTTQGLLSAVLYAEQSIAIRASEALLQQCGDHVTPRDVAPLAVGLYSEEFHRFLRRNVARGQVVNIGVIVQAEQGRLGAHRPATVEFFPGEDLQDGLESLFL